MTNNDVRRIYTQKVSELLAKGYQIHYETMSGSQGELAHIDLSDGNEILRVLLEREGNYGGSYGRAASSACGSAAATRTSPAHTPSGTNVSTHSLKSSGTKSAATTTPRVKKAFGWLPSDWSAGAGADTHLR